MAFEPVGAEGRQWPGGGLAGRQAGRQAGAWVKRSTHWAWDAWSRFLKGTVADPGVFGHTSLKAPDPVFSGKLSRVGPA